MDKQTNEGGRGWYELRITIGKFEAIATGGFSNTNDQSHLVSFFGVGVPAALARDEHFILFYPVTATETNACERMLRNYQRNLKS